MNVIIAWKEFVTVQITKVNIRKKFVAFPVKCDVCKNVFHLQSAWTYSVGVMMFSNEIISCNECSKDRDAAFKAFKKIEGIY